MAITIDWATKVISIPKADLTLLQTTPIEVRQLDITTFHEALRDLEDGFDGIVNPVTHNYTAPTEISGVILAQVMEILNPYTVTFEDGQYAVNVTGGNSNIADKVNINNVGIRTANSAGLQDLTSLQAASFSDGAVAVKMSSQYSGTVYPVGTRGYPVNNISDAHDIAEARGLNKFIIMESMTIDNEVLVDGYVFEGDNPSLVTLTINDAAQVSNAVFRRVKVQGVLDNFNILEECITLDLTHVNGFIYECSIIGDITIGGTNTCTIVNSFSGSASEAEGMYPYVGWEAGSTADLVVRNFGGDMGIVNCTEAINASYNFNGGRLHFETTCVNGTHNVRGDADVYNESGGSAIIHDETIHKLVENSNNEVTIGVQKSSLLIPYTPTPIE